MNTNFFDVLVAKQYETKQSGKLEQKVAWNKIGRAWPSKSGASLNFELYLFPNQRYVIQLINKPRNQENQPTNATL